MKWFEHPNIITENNKKGGEIPLVNNVDWTHWAEEIQRQLWLDYWELLNKKLNNNVQENTTVKDDNKGK